VSNLLVEERNWDLGTTRREVDSDEVVLEGGSDGFTSFVRIEVRMLERGLLMGKLQEEESKVGSAESPTIGEIVESSVLACPFRPEFVDGGFGEDELVE